jgi:3-phenylpropionate/trans-cinnamate dioxygenase ferredoxin reductase subunit
MLLGRQVIALDPAAQTVTTDGDDDLGYGLLIWATGGAPRKLPSGGHHLRGVHTVRTRADVDRMAHELGDVIRAVVIGGGYIGLEAAAVLAKAGKQVVILEAMERVLARVAGEPLSRFLESEHRSHGVEVRLAARTAKLLGEGVVTGVQMDDGEVLVCQMVIVGIGIIPAVEPLLAAGAAGENGVDVDAQCRTTLRNVFAIGDCARHPNPFADGTYIRLESVQNANDQAVVVAKVITGQGAEYRSVPWFWSNQYDIKLQTVGLAIGHDATVVRGVPTSRSFSMIYLKEGCVVALDCVNVTKDYVQGRQLVLDRLVADSALLADATAPLKELVQRRL